MNSNRDTYHIIGVMSGTSLDGIDMCEIKFVKNQTSWNFTILKAQTVPYSMYWKRELSKAIGYSKEQLERLDFKYTQKLSDEISSFIRRNNIQEIDAICSHGHTVLHRPDLGMTYQIGNLPRISKLLGQKVVCDFRVQDVELQGQGAPLVPIGDLLLFSEYDFCLNLGGFANCSFQKDSKRIAFDICPANIVLNHYAKKLGKEYDTDGILSRSGNIDLSCLEMLNSLPFYSLHPPKSLGLEWVKEYIFPVLDDSKLSAKDILRTFTEHIAIQLAKQFSDNQSILITGGGAYNLFLIERIRALTQVEIVTPSPQIIEFKEALIFGLLGVLKLREEVNCLASVTGAKRDHSSGKIFDR